MKGGGHSNDVVERLRNGNFSFSNSNKYPSQISTLFIFDILIVFLLVSGTN